MIGDYNPDLTNEWIHRWEYNLAQIADNPYQLPAVPSETYDFIQAIKELFSEIDRDLAFDMSQIVAGTVLTMTIIENMEVQPIQELSAAILRCCLIGLYGREKFFELPNQADLGTPQISGIETAIQRLQIIEQFNTEDIKQLRRVLRDLIDCEQLYIDDQQLNLEVPFTQILQLICGNSTENMTDDLDNAEATNRLYTKLLGIPSIHRHCYKNLIAVQQTISKSYDGINCTGYFTGEQLKTIVGSIVSGSGDLPPGNHPIYSLPNIDSCLTMITTNFAIASMLSILGKLSYGCVDL